ncbi:MAG: GTPase RsgA [Saprospirales bacterium]|nr:GTPase RsgA [Saprospirales bacterium]
MQLIYPAIGYDVINVSATNGKGIDELKQLLTNKTSLIAGHSGVGKSTFGLTQSMHSYI